jgi:hypothetical protein
MLHEGIGVITEGLLISERKDRRILRERHWRMGKDEAARLIRGRYRVVRMCTSWEEC